MGLRQWTRRWSPFSGLQIDGQNAGRELILTEIKAALELGQILDVVIPLRIRRRRGLSSYFELRQPGIGRGIGMPERMIVAIRQKGPDAQLQALSLR